MATLESNVKILSQKLRESENDLRQKANFCNEHKFSKEEEWLRMNL